MDEARPWRYAREVFNGVLWILGTGAQWRELPDRYPPYQTCHRRFQQWTLAEELEAQGRLNLDEAFVDATFAAATKKGLGVGLTKRGKGTKIVAVADGHPVSVESASPHESQLVEEVLAQSFLNTLPARLIGDKAYDLDRLDQHLWQRYGIELIAPHLRSRRHPTQDGRPCDDTADAGASSGCLPGCTGFGGWARAGNITPRTSSAWFGSVASSYCSGIYETGSSHLDSVRDTSLSVPVRSLGQFSA